MEVRSVTKTQNKEKVITKKKSVKIRAIICVICVPLHPKNYLTKKAALAIKSFPPNQKPLKIGLSNK